jgi:hypothetical protein
VIALERQVLAQSAVTQLEERAKLLRPVPRNSPTNRENSQPRLPQERGGKMFQVLEGIKANLMTAGTLSHSIV